MYRTLKIGLSMRVVTAAGYAERRDAISQEWMLLLESWEAIPVLMPNTFSDIGALLEMVDLVILTGGNDVTVDPRGVPRRAASRARGASSSASPCSPRAVTRSAAAPKPVGSGGSLPRHSAPRSAPRRCTRSRCQQRGRRREEAGRAV